MVKKKLRIEGMHCVNCAMIVDGALEELAGVKAASTNYARQCVDVEYDEEQVTVDDLVRAIGAAGYQVAG